MSDRKPSLTLVTTANAPKVPDRKPSLTSMTITAPSKPERKPSLTSMALGGAGLPARPERKPSITSMTAAVGASASPGTPRGPERKPSLTSMTGLSTVKPAGERKPSLTAMTAAGMAAFASSSRNLLQASPGTPRAPPSRRVGTEQQQQQPSSPNTSAQKRSQKLMETRSRRSFSGPRNETDLRFEIFFHVPSHTELQRLRVHRSLTLIGLQAMVQREFAIPFEDQRIYCHGDLLEGDDDLAFYDIHEQSVLNVRVRKRYRPIGDVFTKIKTVRLLSRPATSLIADDFEIVEVVAPLPPTAILFRRLVLAISYLQRLDKLQLETSGRRVWKHKVTFLDDPATVGGFSHRRGSLGHGRATSTTAHPENTTAVGNATLISTTATLTTAADPAVDEPSVASFVMQNCGPERVAHVVSLAQAHSISQRLRHSPDNRSTADIRHIKKWLGSIKYFSNANIPDTALQEVARACVYVRFKSGDFIFRQGDIGDHFYILITGCVSLAAYGNGYFSTLTPGRCFGEISLFEGQGLRTASANVDFAAPCAELAIVSGEIYRRVINPYKQAVLQNTEKAIYSVPQLRSLPDNIVTHMAYASKTVTPRSGKRLIHHGEEVNVLVLLVKGEVKVSTPKRPPCLRSYPSSIQKQHTFDLEVPFPVVSVVRAPAVFCQEGCLTNTPSPAPWDIEAIDNCTLVCLRIDTISIFLAPRHDIIRALNNEHVQRICDFQRRFGTTPTDAERAARRQSAAKLSLSKKKASHLRLLSSSKIDESTRSIHTSHSRHKSSGKPTRIEFPKILMRLEDEDSISVAGSSVSPRKSDFQGSQSSISPVPSSAHPEQKSSSPRQSSPSCAEMQDKFLHQTLPFGNILGLRDQIRFVSFGQQRECYESSQHPSRRRSPYYLQDQRGRTRALLHGLRQLEVEEVELLTLDPADDQGDLTQYHFVARPPTSTFPISNSTGAGGRDLHTR